MMRFICEADDLYTSMDSDAVQTCLDISFDLAALGRYEDIVSLLSGLEKSRVDCRRKPLYYVLGYYKNILLMDGTNEYNKAKAAELGNCYPVRFEEIKVLEDVIAKTDDNTAKMLLGCLLYNKLHYEKAAELWENASDNYIAKRNLAVAYFSHLNKSDEALSIMKELITQRPDDEELLYETVVLMDKMRISATEKINLLTSHRTTRDDVLTELAKAYNQAFKPEKAVETLMSHDFVPCEGGEHAIADQYMFAYLVMGKRDLDSGNVKNAMELFRKGQILPQSLGAGIWNHCKLIPLKYHEALCLEKLDKKAEADEIFSYIANVTIEYFSNMHLKELPYWQAKAFMHLGEPTKAQHLITKYLREWDKIQYTSDNGYFGTTPFFIPFIDEPQRLRKAQHLYLTSLCADYANEKCAKEKIGESIKLNNDNLFALYFDTFGFLE